MDTNVASNQTQPQLNFVQTNLDTVYNNYSVCVYCLHILVIKLFQ